jgi:hypothetical protein
MKRQLSSRATFFWKFIFPPVWILGFGLAAVSFFRMPPGTLDSRDNPIPDFIRWMFPIMWVFFSIFILWLSVPLKKLARDEKNLYVSNFRTKITVPVTSIAKVRENRAFHIGGKHPIIIELTAPTVFGRNIVFIPTGKAPFSWPWQKKPHPVAAELQNLATDLTANL